MLKHASFALLGMGCCLIAGLVALELPAVYGQDAKAPEWKHGLDLRVRRAGEGEFGPKTPKFGAEFYLDKNAGNAMCITETGSLGVAPGASLGGGTDSKAPKWLHGLELKVRKAGEKDFGPNTPRYGIEVFKDENSSNLIYISQTGDIAIVKAGNVGTVTEPKKPTWLHGLELKCRKGGELDFGPTKFGIEVFRDDNAGTLVYITETGAIAVLPTGTGGGVKEPTWLHGLDFRVRKAGEANFTPKTANFGAEVFKDENANNIVFITEKGSIGVAPAGSATGGDTKAPKWMAGLELKVRKAGEKNFDKDTKKYGAEIFLDLNTNHLVYITETCSLAVIAGK